METDAKKAEAERGPRGGRTDWRQLTLRITKAQWDALTTRAKELGTKPTTQIQGLVDEYLARPCQRVGDGPLPAVSPRMVRTSRK